MDTLKTTTQSMNDTSKNYYKIGEFAKLAHVSISKLRYYDEIGLLKPSIRSKDSSYRFYAPTQLDRVAMIKSFQRHGMPLQQLTKLLHNKNAFFEQMAIFSNNKVEELNRQIDTLIQMRNEYESLALNYPVLAHELKMDQILYAPISSYKIIETDFYREDFFSKCSTTEEHFYMQDLCKQLSSVQWFSSDTGYRVSLKEPEIQLNGTLLYRLSSRHPQITSNALKTVPSADYLRYIAPMNEQDIKDNFQKMLSYCNEISRTPESYGYTWFMVDDYDDGTGRPIIQLCIPLIPIDSKK